MVALSQLDAQILTRVQQAFPLTPRPFAELAVEFGIDEGELLERLGRLKHEAGIIRQISAVFDSRALGYRSILVAAKYRADGIEQAARIINEHPGVSHNYGREHEFNLWYTLAVGPDSRLGLARTVRLLHQLSGALATRQLVALKTYKLDLQLDLSQVVEPRSRGTFVPEQTAQPQNVASPVCPPRPVSPADVAMIRALQRDLPLVPRPYDELAADAGCRPEELLAAAQRFLRTGWMRRFGALLQHREAGFAANVLAVWHVPAEQADEMGRRMARFRAVSHCYLRKSSPDWPYNLYTMIHGRTREECLATLEAIRQATGLTDRRDLWTTREYKKVRLRYFDPQEAAWEARYSLDA